MAKRSLNRLTPGQRVLVIVGCLVVAVIFAQIRGCKQQPEPTPGEVKTLANRNVRFGMPAEAKTDPANRTAYLIERPQYVLSYNDDTKNPNWVCWNLTKSDIGKTKRRERFEPDPDLPREFIRITHDDYDGFGFDRGHMCPSADRDDTAENNRVTFYMTNVVPQAPNNNQKGWGRLENHCRNIAEEGNELYIACGPHGQGGTGRISAQQTIGSATRITVPASVWKVVLVLPNKEAVPNTNTRTIAVWMPNDQTVTSDWKQYRVSVATVEERTGYRFFPLVPDDVANPIKTRVDTEP
ncbi:MAG: DNA/RNA non-specific endonuclease [Planctomycetia bacterium]|nr:DNA/RNA non-specific endonuclease [Planctomycetia bacterium]